MFAFLCGQWQKGTVVGKRSSTYTKVALEHEQWTIICRGWRHLEIERSSLLPSRNIMWQRELFFSLS